MTDFFYSCMCCDKKDKDVMPPYFVCSSVCEKLFNSTKLLNKEQEDLNLRKKQHEAKIKFIKLLNKEKNKSDLEWYKNFIETLLN